MFCTDPAFARKVKMWQDFATKAAKYIVSPMKEGKPFDIFFQRRAYFKAHRKYCRLTHELYGIQGLFDKFMAGESLEFPVDMNMTRKLSYSKALTHITLYYIGFSYKIKDPVSTIDIAGCLYKGDVNGVDRLLGKYRFTPDHKGRIFDAQDLVNDCEKWPIKAAVWNADDLCRLDAGWFGIRDYHPAQIEVIYEAVDTAIDLLLDIAVKRCLNQPEEAEWCEYKKIHTTMQKWFPPLINIYPFAETIDDVKKTVMPSFESLMKDNITHVGSTAEPVIVLIGELIKDHIRTTDDFNALRTGNIRVKLQDVAELMNKLVREFGNLSDAQ